MYLKLIKICSIICILLFCNNTLSVAQESAIYIIHRTMPPEFKFMNVSITHEKNRLPLLITFPDKQIVWLHHYPNYSRRYFFLKIIGTKNDTVRLNLKVYNLLHTYRKKNKIDNYPSTDTTVVLKMADTIQYYFAYCNAWKGKPPVLELRLQSEFDRAVRYVKKGTRRRQPTAEYNLETKALKTKHFWYLSRPTGYL